MLPSLCTCPALCMHLMWVCWPVLRRAAAVSKSIISPTYSVISSFLAKARATHSPLPAPKQIGEGACQAMQHVVQAMLKCVRVTHAAHQADTFNTGGLNADAIPDHANGTKL